MARVFVSYAHSNDKHRQRVWAFAKSLREQGLDVVIDTDVKSPAGPPEQWPRWMKNQVEAADWVLLFIDEAYRRRFDGHEEPDKGHGVTWEGCIITHELYRSKTINHKFIPVLADDENLNLVPTEIAGATMYRIPSGQQMIAQKILEYEAATKPAGFHSAVYVDWRGLTVFGIADAILRLQTERRRKEVAQLFQFRLDGDRAHLESHFQSFVDRSSAAESFDVEATCLAVAKLDAFRMDAAGHADDLRALTDLQDWLFPLCIHPAIKATVASGMDNRQGAIIQESVALAVGAELCAAPADGRRAGFRLDDRGRVVGQGLLRLVDTPIGDPNPSAVVAEILADLADQLSVSLDDGLASEKDVTKQIKVWTEQLKFQARMDTVRKKRRFYCVLEPRKTPAEAEALSKLLCEIRVQLPELVFFELHRGQTKAAEEVILKIVKDRLESENKS